MKGEPALRSPGSSVLPTYEVLYTSAADTFQKLPHGTRGHRRPRTEPGFHILMQTFTPPKHPKVIVRICNQTPQNARLLLFCSIRVYVSHIVYHQYGDSYSRPNDS